MLVIGLYDVILVANALLKWGETNNIIARLPGTRVAGIAVLK